MNERVGLDECSKWKSKVERLLAGLVLDCWMKSKVEGCGGMQRWYARIENSGELL